MATVDVEAYGSQFVSSKLKVPTELLARMAPTTPASDPAFIDDGVNKYSIAESPDGNAAVDEPGEITDAEIQVKRGELCPIGSAASSRFSHSVLLPGNRNL
jgi:hypothetical protein